MFNITPIKDDPVWKIPMQCVDCFVNKIKIIEEVIDYIATKQGWEETEDIYREHFGLEPKYKKLK